VLATLGLFSLKTLWQGSFHFSSKTSALALCGLKQAENEPKTSYVSDQRLSLGEYVCFQK
jgi:hypothetical protein